MQFPIKAFFLQFHNCAIFSICLCYCTGRLLWISLLRQAGDGFSTFWRMSSGFHFITVPIFSLCKSSSDTVLVFPHWLSVLSFDVYYLKTVLLKLICESNFIQPKQYQGQSKQLHLKYNNFFCQFSSVTTKTSSYFLLT